jgi:leucyl aminopeptidase
MTDFASLLQPDRGQPARDMHVVHPDRWAEWLGGQPPRVRAAVAAHRLTGRPGDKAILPGDAPDDWSALLVCPDPVSAPWRFASMGAFLPEGSYRLATDETGASALGWMLGQYRFARYRKVDDNGPRVLLTADVSRIDDHVRLAEATARVRDMVNTPAADMGPADLEAAVRDLGDRHGARVEVTKGADLERGYPMVHAVGRAAAADRAPRLIELVWGRDDAPRIALVGKGVCFDTGGLDIKTGAGMKLMKKDMGGAAHALALAGLVMAARLPVRLHLIVPAVENAVSATSFRPGDVLATRKGLTVENTNTDAEGRLILGDALTRAGEDRPELLIDFATLTGAARIALGPDLPPMFANDDALAADLIAAADRESDPVWRMPLWDGYDEMLKSDIADMVNAPEGGMAGAVTAALFLRRFVPTGVAWAHFDVFAWRPAPKPGRPKGGDAFALRAVWRVLQDRYPAT